MQVERTNKINNFTITLILFTICFCQLILLSLFNSVHKVEILADIQPMPLSYVYALNYFWETHFVNNLDILKKISPIYQYRYRQQLSPVSLACSGWLAPVVSIRTTTRPQLRSPTNTRIIVFRGIWKVIIVFNKCNKSRKLPCIVEIQSLHSNHWLVLWSCYLYHCTGTW